MPAFKAELLVDVVVDDTGVLRAVTARGHAGRMPRGENVVCAAATVLIRTCGKMFRDNAAFSVEGEPLGRGRLEFVVTMRAGGSTADKLHATDWACAVTETLIRGLRDLAEEHPKTVALTVKERGRGN